MKEVKEVIDTIHMTSTSPDGEKLEVEITGATEMPFWKHDLKLKTAIALLDTVDYKDFTEDRDLERKYWEYIDEIEKIVHCLKNGL